MTSERPTADVVADLRCIADSDMEGDEITVAEAADRLEHFDTYCRMLERLAEEHDELRPPCPTCDGARQVTEPHSLGFNVKPCPDCHDGKMPFERIIAEWQAGAAGVTLLQDGTR